MEVKKTVGMFHIKTCELLLGEAGIIIQDKENEITIYYKDMTDISIACSLGRATRLEFIALGENHEYIIENDEDSKVLIEGLKNYLSADMCIDFKLG